MQQVTALLGRHSTETLQKQMYRGLTKIPLHQIKIWGGYAAYVGFWGLFCFCSFFFLNRTKKMWVFVITQPEYGNLCYREEPETLPRVQQATQTQGIVLLLHEVRTSWQAQILTCSLKKQTNNTVQDVSNNVHPLVLQNFSEPDFTFAAPGAGEERLTAPAHSLWAQHCSPMVSATWAFRWVVCWPRGCITSTAFCKALRLR